MGVAQVIFHFDKITSTLEISTSWGFYECYSIQIRKVDLAGFFWFNPYLLVQSHLSFVKETLEPTH